MLYTIKPPMRSKPTKAYTLSKIRATVTASGSGPLSSLLFFNVLFVLLTLNEAGNVESVLCSNSSLLSQTKAPVLAFHMLKERPPKQKMLSYFPSLSKSPHVFETAKRPKAVFALSAVTFATPPNLAVSNT